VTSFVWDAAKGEATHGATVAALTAEEQAGEAFNSAAEIVVTAGGRWYYTSNRGHDTVAVFRSRLGDRAPAENPAAAGSRRVSAQHRPDPGRRLAPRGRG
jgi:hypothetical protein